MSALIAATADALGVPYSSVLLTARRLQALGRLPHKTRCGNPIEAFNVTPSDAALLLTSSLALPLMGSPSENKRDAALEYLVTTPFPLQLVLRRERNSVGDGMEGCITEAVPRREIAPFLPPEIFEASPIVSEVRRCMYDWRRGESAQPYRLMLVTAARQGSMVYAKLTYAGADAAEEYELTFAEPSEFKAAVVAVSGRFALDRLAHSRGIGAVVERSVNEFAIGVVARLFDPPTADEVAKMEAAEAAQ